jgi:dimethylargininase
VPTTPHATHALVRGIPDTFDDCIKPPGSPQPIDLPLARRQHEAYCAGLRRVGLRLVEIEADERFPDCVFIEDTAIVAGDCAVMCRFGVESRRGEEDAVEPVLGRHKRVCRIGASATIEGGDVMRIGSTLYVGVTSRTDIHGVRRLANILRESDFGVQPVETHGVFHLKSAVTYLGDGYIALSRGCFDESVFSRYKKIEVPPGESYATNCLAVNGTVFVSAGFPATRDLIEAEGFHVSEVEASEFKKAGGSLTCLSILL